MYGRYILIPLTLDLLMLEALPFPVSMVRGNLVRRSWIRVVGGLGESYSVIWFLLVLGFCIVTV